MPGYGSQDKQQGKSPMQQGQSFSSVGAALRERVKGVDFVGVAKDFAIPGVAALAVTPPYTVGKKLQTYLQTGVWNKPLLSGGLEIVKLQLSRFALRIGFLPIVTQYAVDHRPDGVSVGSTKMVATVANGLVADSLILSTERMAVAKQSYKPESGMPTPSFGHYWKNNTSSGFVREVNRGFIATIGFRQTPFWVAMALTKRELDKRLPENPTLSAKLSVAGVSAFAATSTNVALTPFSGVVTSMQRYHDPLPLRGAIADTFTSHPEFRASIEVKGFAGLIKEKGFVGLVQNKGFQSQVKLAYRGASGRGWLTAVSATGMCLTMVAQEMRKQYDETGRSR